MHVSASGVASDPWRAAWYWTRRTEASLDVRSLEVREKALYDRRMGPDFFAADAHPKLTVRSTGAEKRDETHWRVT